jgi:hypothetical protein
VDGSLPASSLKGRLADHKAERDMQIAGEPARPSPDDVLVRRLMRERMLARDRLAALAGAGMPRWARPGVPPAE